MHQQVFSIPLILIKRVEVLSERRLGIVLSTDNTVNFSVKFPLCITIPPQTNLETFPRKKGALVPWLPPIICFITEQLSAEKKKKNQVQLGLN